MLDAGVGGLDLGDLLLDVEVVGRNLLVAGGYKPDELISHQKRKPTKKTGLPFLGALGAFSALGAIRLVGVGNKNKTWGRCFSFGVLRLLNAKEKKNGFLTASFSAPSPVKKIKPHADRTTGAQRGVEGTRGTGVLRASFSFSLGVVLFQNVNKRNCVKQKKEEGPAVATKK